MSVVTHYTADEIVDRGEEIYAKTLRPQVESDNIGKYIAIDILTGNYEIGNDHLETVNRLRARIHDAVTCALKIGYSATASIGGRLRPNLQ